MTVTLSKNGKRLGRPPKNKDTIITSTKTKKIVTEQVENIDMSDTLECNLMPISEYSHINSEIKKYGRYAQSTYSLSRYGKNAFIVLAYLSTDIEKHRKDGFSDEQIVKKCVNYINATEKSKRYGNLKLYNYRIINKFDKDIFAIELVTDSRTSENFWGSGNR